MADIFDANKVLIKEEDRVYVPRRKPHTKNLIPGFICSDGSLPIPAIRGAVHSVDTEKKTVCIREFSTMNLRTAYASDCKIKRKQTKAGKFHEKVQNAVTKSKRK